ncbi:beta-N-acetylhexosaminidase [Actinomyces howellii]|uniref:beta-N-acetylhexosaminidase n=1 Tax=Actinomyces howellii TaxID=52771 RepID=A0A448HG32_9ACTO|nr:family 20 glycosylhydrolase [Actinomyces howellii]VEG27568.1 Beta-N-acetylhexosaminidase [Actinomyces howellii]
MIDSAVDAPCDPTTILPRPRRLNAGQGTLELRRTTPLLCAHGTEPAAEWLAQRLRDGLGWGAGADLLPLRAPGPQGCAVRLVLDPRAGDGPEDYRLRIDAQGVEVSGAGAPGVMHGARTLLSLLPPRALAADGASWSPAPAEGDPVIARLPHLLVEDGPRLGYRGLMLDVARSFLPVAEVCAIVEAAALAKINVLHLHLVDDQGWRLEITNDGREPGDTIDYTALTRVSGATAVAGGGYAGRPGRTGWYTQADYRRIVAFCRSRCVEVVPEIDVPGHVGAALHAVPELCTPGSSHAATPEQPVAPVDGSTAVGRSYLDPGSPATLRFLRHVLGQVAALDPAGRRIHLGGDEPWAMAERYGIGPGSPYAELLRSAQRIVRELGREPMGWNEAVSAGPQAGVLQLWHAGTQERAALARAAQEGARFVMSPSTRTYLDQKYDASSPIGLTWAGAVDVPAARDWDPDEQLEGLTPGAVIGVEAPLWSETVRSRADAEWLIFPRLLATAEVGWSPVTTPGDRQEETEAFLRRCAAWGPRMAAMGTSFHRAGSVPWADYGPVDGDGLPGTGAA